MGRRPAKFNNEPAGPIRLTDPGHGSVSSHSPTVPADQGTRERMLSDANEIVKSLSGEFASMVDRFILDMIELTEKLRSQEASRAAALKHIYRISHEIKGQGTTFGFDLLTSIGDNLCSLIARARSDHPGLLRAIVVHVDAFRLTRSREIQGEGGAFGLNLMETLRTEADAICESLAIVGDKTSPP